MAEVQFDPADFRRLMADIKTFSPNLARNLRRELRRTGDSAIGEMGGILGSGPVGGTIARGIRMQVQTSKASQGIRIVSTGSGLPAAKRPLVKAFNMSTFRHPVFGDRDVWVNQSGRPYFGTVIYKRRDAIREAVESALSDAVKEIT